MRTGDGKHWKPGTRPVVVPAVVRQRPIAQRWIAICLNGDIITIQIHDYLPTSNGLLNYMETFNLDGLARIEPLARLDIESSID